MQALQDRHAPNFRRARLVWSSAMCAWLDPQRDSASVLVSAGLIMALYMATVLSSLFTGVLLLAWVMAVIWILPTARRWPSGARPLGNRMIRLWHLLRRRGPYSILRHVLWVHFVLLDLAARSSAQIHPAATVGRARFLADITAFAMVLAVLMLSFWVMLADFPAYLTLSIQGALVAVSFTMGLLALETEAMARLTYVELKRKLSTYLLGLAASIALQYSADSVNIALAAVAFPAWLMLSAFMSFLRIENAE